MPPHQEGTSKPRLRPGKCAASPLAVALAIVLLATAGPALATLYKWVDANGRTVYSDQPPAGNVKVETVGAPPPPSNPNAIREMASKEGELKKRQIDKNEEAKKADKARADAEKMIEPCNQARGQIKQLEQSMVVIYRYNVKGEAIALDDAARSREREQFEKFIRENCPA